MNTANVTEIAAAHAATSANVSTVAGAAQADTALHFEEGGQQVNSYSWVLGAANIMNGSRFFLERLGASVRASMHPPTCASVRTA